MNDIELVRNCVMQIRRPFDAKLVSTLTGVTNKVVQRALADLESAGQIKCISAADAIYVRTKRYTRPYTPDDLPWAVYPEKAVPLLDLLERQSFSNGRKMAKALGMSHQWVYVYLKALVSAGAVRKVRGKYAVNKRISLRHLSEEYRSDVLRTPAPAPKSQRRRKARQRSA
jgi:DNA-binding transcriptional regulator YhcF (GntR family)